ncbi:MAG: PAS domain S-box protein [Bryobacteraceae bacterium]
MNRTLQRIQSLIDNVPLAVVEWDPDHHITGWRGSAERMFGWSEDEVRGKRAGDLRLVYEDDWNAVYGAMDAMEHGWSWISRNRNYRKDGSVIHCEWYNSVMLDKAGNLGSGLSLVLDVTARQRAEEALRTSEEKFRSIFEGAPIGIFQSTVEGRLLSVNPRLAEMFGFGSPEHMRTAITGVSHHTDPERRRAMIDRALEAGDFVQAEVEYRRPDGSVFPANLCMKAAHGRNGIVLEGFVEDITERKRAEEALRGAHDALERRVQERTAELSSANERLQELDRLKSQFLASMSHELRTPLNSIIGFTSLLRRGLAGPVNPEQKKQLDIVYSSARHLLTLINDLLDVSRIEAGRADVDHEPFDFVDVVTEVVRSLKPMADRKGLEVTTALAAPAIPINGDRKRTLQVLLNLVNNAIKFTAKGSVHIAAAVEGRNLVVSVTDTGIGIKQEHLGMLFEAFRQVDGSVRRVYEGTGLGLYLCRKLLHLMGGKIEVESEYGSGSRFTYTQLVDLPADSAEFIPETVS